jgi:hypothetical protein
MMGSEVTGLLVDYITSDFSIDIPQGAFEHFPTLLYFGC